MPAMLETTKGRLERPEISERYVLGPNGEPLYAESWQKIRAIGSTAVRTIPYMFDTNELDNIEVTHGGTADIANEQHVSGTTFRLPIELEKPLEPGKSMTLAFRTFFKSDVAYPPEFRRAIRDYMRVGKLGMSVVFSGDLFPEPGNIWETTWDVAEPHGLLRETSVELRAAQDDHNVQSMVRSFVRINPQPETLLGFRWKMPAQV